jgi:hypothetical protein
MAITGRLKVLMAVAAAVVAYIAYTGGEQPVAGSATPAVRANTASPRAAGAGQGNPAPAAGRNVSSAGNDESARLYAKLTHRVSEGPSAASLFKATSWYTPPPPPPPAPVAVAPPPPAPTAPPLPFAAMGSYSRPGDRKVYFLTRGDRVFDVRAGDTIDNIYSVDKEEAGQLQLTYKPLGIQQSLPLGGSQ